MNEPLLPAEDQDPAPRVVGTFGAYFAAWALIAAVGAFLIAIRIPWKSAGALVRTKVHFYDASQLVAIGLLSGLVARLWEIRGPRRPVWAWLALIAGAMVVGEVVLAEDVVSQANRWEGFLPNAFSRHAMMIGTSLLLPAAAFTGGVLDRRRVRVFAALFGASFAFLNGFIFATRYEGIHFVAAIMAALFIARALRHAPLPRRLSMLPRPAVASFFGLLTVLGAAALLVWPSNAVLIQLFNAPSSILMPYLVKLRLQNVSASVSVPSRYAEWFTDRSTHPPIPPSAPPLLPANPIIILLTFDSIRAEMFLDPKYTETFPMITRLRNESVYFTQAHSAGCSTETALSSLFTSRYEAQLYFSRKTAGADTSYLPFEDRSPRFPELLAKAGYQTILYGVQPWMMNEFGIAKGFTEETLIGTTPHYPRGATLVVPAIERLQKQDDQPAFLYMHLLDAHWPYRTAGVKPTEFEGYIAEIAYLDTQLRAIWAMLARKHWLDRVVLIVTADHGEAFGDHGLSFHGTSLYEEPFHVPLMIHAPGIKPRRVTDRVSLIDVAPTILDLAHLEAPGLFMGQSLVPYLRGESPVLTRPIIAEGAKKKRAMIETDGVVTIQDTRKGTLEIFSLNDDPAELSSIEDDPRIDKVARLGLLAKFFEVQTLRRPGYVPPL